MNKFVFGRERIPLGICRAHRDVEGHIRRVVFGAIGEEFHYVFNGRDSEIAPTEASEISIGGNSVITFERLEKQ